MRKIVTFCFLLLLGVGAMAQQKVVEVWPGQVPGATKPKQARVVDLKTEPGTIRVVEVTNPTLEVYEPTGPNNGIGVIVCPGGGYGMLAYDKEGTDVAQWLAKQGFTAFALAYRVPQQREGALQDIQRAIRLARQQYKLDKVGAIGFSAGASLSARAATHHEATYAGIDAADEQSCRPDFAMLIYPAYLDEGGNRTLTPELTITKQTPPMFIFATADDYFGNSALTMAQALRDCKIPVELHFMAVGGHGYGMRQGAGLQWPVYAESWLKEVVRK